jgi:DNA-binding transcriptional LysR family regulator
MDLRHLRYIVAAARNGSFRAAANELNVTQPIVSKRKEVEDELGVRLFERSTAGARLTLLGEDFVVDARRVLDDTDQMARHAKASRAGTFG